MQSRARADKQAYSFACCLLSPSTAPSALLSPSKGCSSEGKAACLPSSCRPDPTRLGGEAAGGTEPGKGRREPLTQPGGSAPVLALLLRVPGMTEAQVSEFSLLTDFIAALNQETAASGRLPWGCHQRQPSCKLPARLSNTCTSHRAQGIPILERSLIPSHPIPPPLSLPHPLPRTHPARVAGKA